MKDKQGTPYVPIYFDWLEKTQDLEPEEKGNLIDAIIMYAAGQECEHLLKGGAKIAFRFLKSQIDRNNKISDIRSNAAKGSKDEEEETKESKPEQNGTKENKTEQTGTKAPKEKDKEKDKYKEKDKEKEKTGGRFTPPTLEQVTEYCQERKNGVNPVKWYNYYLSNGWKVGKNPMKDWKAAVRTWEEGNKGGDVSAGKPTKTVVAQQYQQRDYSNVTDDLRSELDREMQEFMRGTA